MPTPRGPVLPSYSKADERISDTELAAIIDDATPHYAFRSGNEWTWTRSVGVWKINLTRANPNAASTGERIVTARLESAGSIPVLKTDATRNSVNALLRWLILVNAIDRHPDDPIAQ